MRVKRRVGGGTAANKTKTKACEERGKRHRERSTRQLHISRRRKASDYYV